MRLAGTCLALLLVWQAGPHATPELSRFQYERSIRLGPGAQGRTCAELDATMYAHSNSLNDIRLYAGSEEVPYALVTSQAAAGSESASVLNLGQRGRSIVFDLQMPTRPYSTVILNLAGQNYLATATVTGLNDSAQPPAQGTSLGAFTLFDLTGQNLGHSTSLGLAESSFAFLHVELAAAPAPGTTGFVAAPAMVLNAEIPPSREAQTLYTPVAKISTIVQQGRESRAVFDLPARVPVEQVSFSIDPGSKVNFSRGVKIVARAERLKQDSAEASPEEEMYGEISRVRLTLGGKEIRREQLSIPATVGSNSQSAAHLVVAVENGDDKPLPLRGVSLEMRERKLCFDAPAQPVVMRYGDPGLVPPVYDYAKLFHAEDATIAGRLEAEQANPGYAPTVVQQTLTDRYPWLVWVALLAVIAALGVVALRSAKRV